MVTETLHEYASILGVNETVAQQKNRIGNAESNAAATDPRIGRFCSRSISCICLYINKQVLKVRIFYLKTKNKIKSLIHPSRELTPFYALALSLHVMKKIEGFYLSQCGFHDVLSVQ